MYFSVAKFMVPGTARLLLIGGKLTNSKCSFLQIILVAFGCFGGGGGGGGNGRSVGG